MLHRLLYVKALVGEFRWSLASLLLALCGGAALYVVTPLADGRRLSFATALYAAWMAMLAQPVESPPATWQLTALCAAYPLVGFLLVGEGVVRFALLMISRRDHEEEWMKVMASTQRNHVILCGLGHLGYRVLEQLLSSGVDVVAIERDPEARFVTKAKKLGVPVLLCDMKEDESLVDAGVQYARAIVIATNDDMANLEVAMDARKMNPKIRVTMRLYDQQIAAKLAETLLVDAAYSASALAAPYVAALSLATKITPSTVIGGVPHVTSELRVGALCAWAGRRIDEIEKEHPIRVLARTQSNGSTEAPAPPETIVEVNDVLVVHCRADDLAALTEMSQRSQATAS